MGQSVSQGITSTQFFLYGKSRFTRTGWEKASLAYKHSINLDEFDLKGRVYVVTGANSGIGFCVSQTLAQRGGHVYMVCRNQERGEKAKVEIEKASPKGQVELLIADCGLRSDVVKLVNDLGTRVEKVDGLICSAGALLNERTLSSEGVEVTLATHLAFGCHLLTHLAMPLLRKSSDPRVVVVSSGGMYNTKFPSWDIASSEAGKYDGALAYSYAKRGQVLLCEEWTKHYPSIKFVSCHPGWTDTPGVDSAFGSSKRHLEPMRSLYQGSEGIVWLAAVPSSEIEGGAFYLDRTPQRKHLAGPFFSDGSFTKNTPGEVAEMISHLDKLSGVTTVPISSEEK